MIKKQAIPRKPNSKSANNRHRPKAKNKLVHVFDSRIEKKNGGLIDIESNPYAIWSGDVLSLLQKLPDTPLFSLAVTSPPYNLGKAYETKTTLDKYLEWQEKIISEVCKRLKPNGSICWQVGNYVENGHIIPLDILLHPLFTKRNLKLRNRIIWHFGHGLHSKRRFSGRHEVILWYTNGDDYTFNLDAVRVRSKYLAKRRYKGSRAGEYSTNFLGKNPEDSWDTLGDFWRIPNVKSNHVEKTSHPCQFPVGLIERLVLSLSNESDLIFDPFMGVGSAGVAAALHKRRFWGAELQSEYASVAKRRITEALNGKAKYRPHSKPIYDYTTSKLSIRPMK